MGRLIQTLTGRNAALLSLTVVAFICADVQGLQLIEALWTDPIGRGHKEITIGNEGYVTINLPFAFSLPDANARKEAFIGRNGFVAFSSPQDDGNGLPAAHDLRQDSISALWAKLNGGRLYYGSSGVARDRVVYITWVNFSFDATVIRQTECAVSVDGVTFQVVLFEDNSVEVRYRKLPVAGCDIASVALGGIGVENWSQHISERQTVLYFQPNALVFPQPQFLSSVEGVCRLDPTEFLAFDCTDGALDTIPEQIPEYPTKLDLSRNKITALKERNFLGLASLVTLLLASNFLEVIERGAFRSILQLEVLDLSNNAISEVEDGSFSDMTRLRRLDLGGNELFHFTGIVKTTMLALTSLNLARNVAVELKGGDFNTGSNFANVDVRLANNAVRLVDPKAFEGVKSVDMTNNPTMCVLTGVGLTTCACEGGTIPIALNETADIVGCGEVCLSPVISGSSSSVDGLYLRHGSTTFGGHVVYQNMVTLRFLFYCDTFETCADDPEWNGWPLGCQWVGEKVAEGTDWVCTSDKTDTNGISVNMACPVACQVAACGGWWVADEIMCGGTISALLPQSVPAPNLATVPLRTFFNGVETVAEESRIECGTTTTPTTSVTTTTVTSTQSSSTTPSTNTDNCISTRCELVGGCLTTADSIAHATCKRGVPSTCYCDPKCLEHNDCCDGYDTLCVTTTTSSPPPPPGPLPAICTDFECEIGVPGGECRVFLKSGLACNDPQFNPAVQAEVCPSGVIRCPATTTTPTSSGSTTSSITTSDSSTTTDTTSVTSSTTLTSSGTSTTTLTTSETTTTSMTTSISTTTTLSSSISSTSTQTSSISTTTTLTTSVSSTTTLTSSLTTTTSQTTSKSTTTTPTSSLSTTTTQTSSFSTTTTPTSSETTTSTVTTSESTTTTFTTSKSSTTTLTSSATTTTATTSESTTTVTSSVSTTTSITTSPSSTTTRTTSVTSSSTQTTSKTSSTATTSASTTTTVTSTGSSTSTQTSSISSTTTITSSESSTPCLSNECPPGTTPLGDASFCCRERTVRYDPRQSPLSEFPAGTEISLRTPATACIRDARFVCPSGSGCCTSDRVEIDICYAPCSNEYSEGACRVRLTNGDVLCTAVLADGTCGSRGPSPCMTTTVSTTPMTTHSSATTSSTGRSSKSTSTSMDSSSSNTTPQTPICASTTCEPGEIPLGGGSFCCAESTVRYPLGLLPYAPPEFPSGAPITFGTPATSCFRSARRICNGGLRCCTSTRVPTVSTSPTSTPSTLSLCDVPCDFSMGSGECHEWVEGLDLIICIAPDPDTGSCPGETNDCKTTPTTTTTSETTSETTTATTIATTVTSSVTSSQTTSNQSVCALDCYQGYTAPCRVISNDLVLCVPSIAENKCPNLQMTYCVKPTTRAPLTRECTLTSYEKTYASGALLHPGEIGVAFTTAFDREFHATDVLRGSNSVPLCQAACTKATLCKGVVVWYEDGQGMPRCTGLADLGLKGGIPEDSTTLSLRRVEMNVSCDLNLVASVIFSGANFAGQVIDPVIAKDFVQAAIEKANFITQNSRAGEPVIHGNVTLGSVIVHLFVENGLTWSQLHDLALALHDAVASESFSIALESIPEVYISATAIESPYLTTTPSTTTTSVSSSASSSPTSTSTTLTTTQAGAQLCDQECNFGEGMCRAWYTTLVVCQSPLKDGSCPGSATGLIVNCVSIYPNGTRPVLSTTSAQIVSQSSTFVASSTPTTTLQKPCYDISFYIAFSSGAFSRFGAKSRAFDTHGELNARLGPPVYGAGSLPICKQACAADTNCIAIFFEYPFGSDAYCVMMHDKGSEEGVAIYTSSQSFVKESRRKVCPEDLLTTIPTTSTQRDKSDDVLFGTVEFGGAAFAEKFESTFLQSFADETALVINRKLAKAGVSFYFVSADSNNGDIYVHLHAHPSAFADGTPYIAALAISEIIDAGQIAPALPNGGGLLVTATNFVSRFLETTTGTTTGVSTPSTTSVTSSASSTSTSLTSTQPTSTVDLCRESCSLGYSGECRLQRYGAVFCFSAGANNTCSPDVTQRCSTTPTTPTTTVITSTVTTTKSTSQSTTTTATTTTKTTTSTTSYLSTITTSVTTTPSTAELCNSECEADVGDFILGLGPLVGTGGRCVARIQGLVICSPRSVNGDCPQYAIDCTPSTPTSSVTTSTSATTSATSTPDICDNTCSSGKVWLPCHGLLDSGATVCVDVTGDISDLRCPAGMKLCSSTSPSTTPSTTPTTAHICSFPDSVCIRVRDDSSMMGSCREIALWQTIATPLLFCSDPGPDGCPSKSTDCKVTATTIVSSTVSVSSTSLTASTKQNVCGCTDYCNSPFSRPTCGTTGEATSYSCRCDQLCVLIGDCCEDYNNECGHAVPTSPPSPPKTVVFVPMTEGP